MCGRKAVQYTIVVVRFDMIGDEQSENCVPNVVLGEILPDVVQNINYIHTLASNEIVLLIGGEYKEGSKEETDLMDSFEQMVSQVSRQLSVHIRIGISATGKGIRDVTLCYHQARGILRTTVSSDISICRYKEAFVPDSSVSLGLLNKLYVLLKAKDSEGIHEILDNTGVSPATWRQRNSTDSGKKG